MVLALPQIVHDLAVEDVLASTAQPAADMAAVPRANGASRPVKANGTTSVAVSSPPHQGKIAGHHHLPRLSFYLDGAHTAESMATCAHWFADEVDREAEDADMVEQASAAAAGVGSQAHGGIVVQRVLLFNCMQVRQQGLVAWPILAALCLGRQPRFPLAACAFKLGSCKTRS